MQRLQQDAGKEWQMVTSPKQDIYTIHIMLKEAMEDGEERMPQLDER